MSSQKEKEILKQIYLKNEQIKRLKKELKELREMLEIVRQNTYTRKRTK